MRYLLTRQNTVLIAAIASITVSTISQPRAFAGGNSFNGTFSSSVYSTFVAGTKTTTVNAAAGQTPSSAQYSGFDVSTANGGSAGGTFTTTTGYPSGTLYTGGLVETGTGNGGSASVSLLGATAGETSTQSSELVTNTWLKGQTESGGYWSVDNTNTTILGGFTNNSGQIGSVTLSLGAYYTTFGALIGTNNGATLDVSIVGYDTATSTQVFSYTDKGIKQATSNPDFTGYAGTTKFNEIIITGLTSSIGSTSTAYPAYPNAAFIAMDQVRVGTNALPEPGTLANILFGGIFATAGLLTRRRRKTQSA